MTLARWSRSDSDLAEVIPDSEGQKETLLIDLRDNLFDGELTHPEGALEGIRRILIWFKDDWSGNHTIVFG